MSGVTTLIGRCIYVWKLEPVLAAEMDIDTFVRKAKKAKFSSFWIKIAEGQKAYRNIIGSMKATFETVTHRLKDAGIAVWGWHVLYAATKDDAIAEAKLVGEIAESFNLDSILMDAESEAVFFKGNAHTATVYAQQLKAILSGQEKGLLRKQKLKMYSAA
jgi:hypothetical protein